MAALRDGPASSLFSPIPIKGNYRFSALGARPFSRALGAGLPDAHRGKSVAWGIPFLIDRALVVRDKMVHTRIAPTKATWLVFLHTSDIRPDTTKEHGFISPTQGIGKLGEPAADYVFIYEDGTEESVTIRRRHEIGSVAPHW